MKQAFKLAADFVEGAVEVHVAKTFHTTIDGLSSIIAKAGEAVLDVFKQAKCAVPWRRRSQGAGKEHGGNAKTCGQ